MCPPFCPCVLPLIFHSSFSLTFNNLFFPPFCPSFPLSNFASTDVLERIRSHEEDDVGEKGEEEDEAESRAEEEQFHFGGDHGGSVGAALSASALITNQLPQDTLPTTTSTQGHLELTNPYSELPSLGKICG